VPSFDYQARAATGAQASGTLEAADERELDRLLEQRGLVLVEARAAGGRRAPDGEITPAELSGLMAQLATLLESGVPLAAGLDTLAERQERRAARAWILGIAGELRAGSALSQALESRARCVPAEVRAAVRAGEASGALAQVLEGLARHLEAQAALAARARQALVYPTLLGLALCGLVLVLLGYLLPRVTSLYPRGAAALPFETRLVLSISGCLREHALWIGCALASIWVLVVLGLRRPGARAALGTRLCRLPRLGRLLRGLAAARFASTAAVLQAAGCDALTLLRVGGEASGSAAFRGAIERARERVERGGDLLRGAGL
jgi:general secretion pathway protein F